MNRYMYMNMYICKSRKNTAVISRMSDAVRAAIEGVSSTSKFVALKAHVQDFRLLVQLPMAESTTALFCSLRTVSSVVVEFRVTCHNSNLVESQSSFRMQAGWKHPTLHLWPAQLVGKLSLEDVMVFIGTFSPHEFVCGDHSDVYKREEDRVQHLRLLLKP